jgi:hypothetical protein
MVDIDLDILTEKPIEIKLFGEKRVLRDLTMEEDFKLKALRQELGKLAIDSEKDEKQHKKKRTELLKLLIDPITDAEIDKLKRKQFDQLMDEIDFLDIRDQGVVKTKEEYNKLKNEMAQRNIGSGMGFPTI